MRMTQRVAALAAGLWIALVLGAGGQPANPFAPSSGAAAASATPAPAAGQPGAGAANPFAAPAPAAPAASAPASANPFAASAPASAPPAGAPAAGPANPFAPPAPGAAPAAQPPAGQPPLGPETATQPGVQPPGGVPPSADPSQPGMPAASMGQPGIDPSTGQPAESDLGMAPAQIQAEVEKAKDRINEYYVRGEYDKAIREVELLEKLSPNNPKAVLIRQRINERLLQGRARPLRDDLNQPVPVAVPLETEAPPPTPVPPEGQQAALPGSGASAQAPPSSAGPTAGTSSDLSLLMPVLAGAAVGIVAIILLVFFYTRRSRQRVQEAMIAARAAMTGPAPGSPSFPAPVPSAPAPFVAPPAFENMPYENSQYATAVPPTPAPMVAETPGSRQPGAGEGMYDEPTMITGEEPEPPRGVYDEPTTILTEDMIEEKARAEAAPPPRVPPPPPPARQASYAPAGDPFAPAASSDPFAAPPPPPAAPIPASRPEAALFGAPPPIQAEAPESHETGGGTFESYGSTGQAIGDVVGGAPAPRAQSRPSPQTAPPMAPAFDAGFGSFDPSAAASESEIPAHFAGADESKLQLPDFLGADGSQIAGGQVMSASHGAIDDPLSPSKAGSAKSPDYLSSSASLPSDFPDPLSPFASGSAPSGPAPGRATPSPSATGTGDLSLNDLLFATGGNDTEFQTKGPAASSSGSKPGPGAPKPGGSGEDLTQMSFGKEFDRLMFGQTSVGGPAATDQTFGLDTLAGGDTLAASPAGGSKRTEDDTYLDSLLAGGASGSPGGSALAQTAFAPPPSPGRPASGSPSPMLDATLPLPPQRPATPARPVSSTVPIDLDQLDATVKLPPASVPPPAAAPAQPLPRAPHAPPPGAPKAPVSQSEDALYRDDRRKGLEAFESGDWKQAVHFLSVAASLHPEDKEVCQRLQEARKQRRSAAGI